MTPTPEITNTTPDNLAKLARLIVIGQPMRREAVGETIDLCVAAWVADRNDAALEKRDKLANAEKLVDLREQLKTSEQACQRAEGLADRLRVAGDRLSKFITRGPMVGDEQLARLLTRPDGMLYEWADAAAQLPPSLATPAPKEAP